MQTLSLTRFIIIAISAACCSTAMSDTADPVQAFSATLNPNPFGPWSYGFRNFPLGSPFNLCPIPGQVGCDRGGCVDSWREPAFGPEMGVFRSKVPGRFVVTGPNDSAAYISGTLGLHPGPNGQYAVVLITVRAPGTYTIGGTFFNMDLAGATTDVHLLMNGIAVADGLVNGLLGPETTLSYGPVPLVAGDTLEYAVGAGLAFSSGSFHDSTGLKNARVTVVALANVAETGGDNDPDDTVPAKWTGVTWTNHQPNEPVLGLAAGAPYTVGLFGNQAPAYVDRNHRYTNASDTIPMPPYLIGQEYIMSGNDNRDNAGYRLDVTVVRDAQVYLLIDNRLGDANNTNPPAFDATHMQWVLDEGWVPVINGLNRSGSTNGPDEVGIDESADGTINQWFSVYTKRFFAGTFQLKQADNAGQNMYGLIVNPGEGFNFNDCLLPPGASFPGAGNAGRIADDGTGGNCVVHLTDANQSGAFGVFSIPAPAGGSNVNSLHMHWRSLVGGDTGSVCTASQFNRPGGDGYSMSWGADLPNPPSYGNPAEEGAGSGLIVTVDTFDNGNGEAPGLEIKWRGARVAFDNIDMDQGLAKDFLRKGVFVEADLTVDTAGHATFTYDGRVLTAALLDWSGIPGGGCIMFGARTGGACDNHWIDDLLIEKFGSDPPLIVQQPMNQSIPCGGTATFNVVATGASPLSYQWQYNTVDLPGATQPTLSIGPVQPADAGTYSVRVSNSAGNVTSAAGTLTALPGAAPHLSIGLVNSNVLIRWPVTCADFDLLETPTVGFASNWMPAAASVSLEGSGYVATSPLQRTGNRFFRLAQRPAGAIPLQPPAVPLLEFSEFDTLPIGATGITDVAWQEIPGSLTDELETQIRFAAQQNSLVRGWLGSRYAYIDTSPLEMPKGTSHLPGEPLQSRVTFFSHSFNWAVLADMNGTTVVGVTNSTELQPPEGADEVAAAVDLARADPRLAGSVQGLIGRGLLVTVATPNQPGFGDRVIYVTFSRPDEAGPRYAALVDLTLQEVISVSTP